MEKRFTTFRTDLKTRSENEEKILEGYFVVYDQETELWPGILEEISKGAVTNSVKNNDIRALFNHDTGTVLGRVGNQTLELKEDDHGLYGKITINENDREANDIYARVDRGDISECSFGFYVIEEDVKHNYEDDTVKFIVKEADVREVSIVAYGAYPSTEISARSRIDQVNEIKALEEKKRMQRIKDIRKKYEGSQE